MIYKPKAHWHEEVTIHAMRLGKASDTGHRWEALAARKNRVAEIAAGKSGIQKLPPGICKKAA